MKNLEVTAAVIFHDKKILICQRPANKNQGLLWEFPGGKMEPGETHEQCIIRECKEELSVILNVKSKLTDILFAYPDCTVHLHFYLCSIAAGAPKKKEHNDMAWITPEEIFQYEFCPADRSILPQICNIYKSFTA